ncbi:MAG: hypothetical protein AAFQ51_14315, partial [Pseudomonadota bacterium]
YARDETFRGQVLRYVITRIDTARPISDRLTPLPKDTAIVESREWAFQRKERLDITVGTPTLRGPIGAEAVTPNSELRLTEADLIERVEGFAQSTGAAQATRSRSADLSVEGFQLALGSMTEAGTISDDAYQNDTALLNTLKERRREQINEVIDSVSRSNESQRFSSTRTVQSRSRDYLTKGKDDVFSTTEVAFQVAATANVEVYLEDVDLAWCPRVEVPFLYLHTLVVQERDRAEARYLEQNQVLDPTQPVLRYETQSFTFELAISGDRRYQRQSFSRRPPGNISGDDDRGGQWEVDRSASTVRFRNGRGDDYDWTERGNWDDLEVHREYFVQGPTLHASGNVVGEACLETTDPEFWNKGFMTYTIVMRRLTAETVRALDEWQRGRGQVEADRRAVAVRAQQYGELKMREAIARFETAIEQRKEVYASLIRLVYAGIAEQHRSFYAETISSCIDWSRASMTFEQPELDGLPFPDYPPTHFMNVSHVRLVLPVNRSAEQSFFDSLANADDYHAAAAQDVRDFVLAYRKRLEELKGAGLDRLDQYSRDMVLGRHVEAVLSHHPFAE